MTNKCCAKCRGMLLFSPKNTDLCCDHKCPCHSPKDKIIFKQGTAIISHLNSPKLSNTDKSLNKGQEGDSSMKGKRDMNVSNSPSSFEKQFPSLKNTHRKAESDRCFNQKHRS